MNERKRKSQKIVFSEEIDSRIEGLTLGAAFIVVGLFLLFVPDYFGNQNAGCIVRRVFIVIGALGLAVEFGKIKPRSAIKGFVVLQLIKAVQRCVFLRYPLSADYKRPSTFVDGLFLPLIC